MRRRRMRRRRSPRRRRTRTATPMTSRCSRMRGWTRRMREQDPPPPVLPTEKVLLTQPDVVGYSKALEHEQVCPGEPASQLGLKDVAAPAPLVVATANRTCVCVCVFPPTGYDVMCFLYATRPRSCHSRRSRRRQLGPKDRVPPPAPPCSTSNSSNNSTATATATAATAARSTSQQQQQQRSAAQQQSHLQQHTHLQAAPATATAAATATAEQQQLARQASSVRPDVVDAAPWFNASACCAVSSPRSFATVVR